MQFSKAISKYFLEIQYPTGQSEDRRITQLHHFCEFHHDPMLEEITSKDIGLFILYLSAHYNRNIPEYKETFENFFAWAGIDLDKEPAHS